MEYRVLARKYRPQTFADLVGQEVLVRTLTNAFATGRVAHAFLLTGIRGVGKTTTARILARALNCVGPDGKGDATITPCGVCTHCTMIAESRHMDVLEMDAASHTGVDDVRGLIDSVQYLPTSARAKVYIVDEVHMLSANAFNALLKTLEEPPPHVKFVFATTEIRKIPVTILSRCQRFDLKRVEAGELARHLGTIASKENVTAESEAFALIADAAEGSVRDALSLFDQAIAASEGPVRAGAVRAMLGMNDKSQLFALLEKLFTGAITEALGEFRAMYAAGADSAMLLQDLLGLVHFVTSIKLSAEAAEDIGYSEAERNFARELARKLSMPALTKVWQMLLKGLQETRLAPDPAAAAEMIFIRIAHSADLPSPADLIRSLRKENGATPLASSSPPAASKAVPVSLITTQQRVAEPRAQAMNAPCALPGAPMPQSFEEIASLFQERREPLLYNYLMRHVQLVAFEKGRIELNVDAEVPVDFAGRVGKCLSDWTGQRWVVVLSHAAGAPPLYASAEAAEEEKRAATRAHPVVAAILEQFPGAEITRLTDLTEPP